MKFQFSSGAINFDNLVVNGNTIDLNPGTCPGTATDTISILQVPINNVDSTICFWRQCVVSRKLLFASGTYRDTIVGGASNTCDIIITALTVSPENIGDTTILVACDSAEWRGTKYFVSGMYNDTLPSAVGCDSIITLDLLKWIKCC